MTCIPVETAVLTLRSILAGRPVLRVEHDDCGGWRFLDSRSLCAGDDLVLASLQEMEALDPTVKEVLDLPPGWQAWRDSATDEWIRESPAREKTRARTAALLAQAKEQSPTLPPGSPSTTALIREGRDGC